MILDKLCAARTTALLVLAVYLPLLGTACGAQQQHEQDSGTPKTIVACTISTLCSLVASVGGNDIDLRGIVPVGASPETFEPTPQDMVAVANAKVLFENGAGLESWLTKVLASAGGAQLTRITLADGIPPSLRASGNPHLWLDPVFATTYVTEIESALASADRAHAASYRVNASRERERLATLDRWIRNQVANVPPERRAMICFHDAWYYFDLRYGMRNIGAVEPSPGQEPSPAYFARLATLARANHVRAVFAEPQFSPRLAQSLAEEAGIRTVTNLYDDTLGYGPLLSNYEGMMRYDVGTIVKALTS